MERPRGIYLANTVGHFAFVSFFIDIYIVICSSDSYVHKKLGDPAWIPAKDRCRLAERAMEYEDSEVSSWISISRGESEADGFVDFPDVTKNFRNFLNNTIVDQKNILKYPLRVVYVCGLDHYNKCSDVERMTKQNNITSAVVFRVGNDDKQISHSVGTSSAMYIPLLKERAKLPDVSSTLIREYFQNPGANKTSIDRYIYPHVRDYMSKKYRKN
jgi:nicotinic acid mononucleotide adenylyltransferase